MPVKSMQRLFLFFITGVVCVAHAETSVWKISKGSNHLFLGGTVHILAQDDYPLPAPFARAYEQAHRLVLETDMQRLQSVEFQQVMLERLSYSGGRTLQDVLSAQTYQKLADYCASRNIPISSIHGFKPGLATTVLLMVELGRLGLTGQGVDAFFSNKARADQKQLGKLETAEQQLDFLVSMGQGEEDQMIEYSLSDIETLPTLMASIKSAWRSGDMQALEQVAISPYVEEFAETMDMLLNQRNQNWLPKIEAMLATAEVELVLVGVLHFAGEQGLLNQLRSRGYDIAQH
ncbi:MAG: TraB/GumN family protein [Gammaproteobacteria bacterium]|nr:TraB/GumN family protein [Gammaproteobacteria bacterium]